MPKRSTEPSKKTHVTTGAIQSSKIEDCLALGDDGEKITLRVPKPSLLGAVRPPPPPFGAVRPPPPLFGAVAASVTRAFEPIELSKPQMPENVASPAWKTKDYVNIEDLAKIISRLFDTPYQEIKIEDLSHEGVLEKISSYCGEEMEFDKKNLSANPAAWTSPAGVIYMGVNAPDYSENGQLDVDKIRSTIIHESLHYFSHMHKGFQEVTNTTVENSNYDEYVTDFFAQKVFKEMYPDSTYKTGYFTKNLGGNFIHWAGNMAKFMIDSCHVTESELRDGYFRTGTLNLLSEQSLSKWKTYAKQKIRPLYMSSKRGG
jgi:insecticidal toxin complex protein TccC